MKNNMLLLFIKFFIYGILGLSLRLAFPQVTVAWWAITFAYAYFALGLRLSLLLLLCLSFFYSAYSMLPFWQWALPIALALVSFSFGERLFSLRPAWRALGLMIYLWFFSCLAWHFVQLFQGVGFWFDPWSLLDLALTVAVGLFILPLLAWLLATLLRRIPRPRRAMPEFPVLRARESWVRGRRHNRRRPFGFEREF